MYASYKIIISTQAATNIMKFESNSHRKYLSGHRRGVTLLNMAHMLQVQFSIKEIIDNQTSRVSLVDIKDVIETLI